MDSNEQILSIIFWILEFFIPIEAFGYLKYFLNQPFLGLIEGMFSASTLIFWIYLYSKRNLGGYASLVSLLNLILSRI